MFALRAITTANISDRTARIDGTVVGFFMIGNPARLVRCGQSTRASLDTTLPSGLWDGLRLGPGILFQKPMPSGNQGREDPQTVRVASRIKRRGVAIDAVANHCDNRDCGDLRVAESEQRCRLHLDSE